MFERALSSPALPKPLPLFLRQSRVETQKKFVDLEWQQRNRLAKVLATSPDEEPSQWTRLSGEEISKRNRYFNIDPWSSNRVRLRVPEGQNDYINASPIVLKSSKAGRTTSFIATQGPKDYSLSHLWQMIWHETGSVGVIVMLTPTHEGGQEKCFQYYPPDLDNPKLEIDEENDTENNFRACIELLESNWEARTRSTLRKLKLTSKDEEKIVWHYLFTGWPDFCIPEDEDRVALLELIKASSLKTDGPRVVHCSAGVGRTGTFIALDHLLDEMTEGAFDKSPEESDPVAECVAELRKQRMMMVQGENQFHFLYEVLKEEWLKRQGASTRPNSAISGLEGGRATPVL